MGKKVTVETMVEGGKASAGPPVGPALGPTGVNLMQVVNKINELTKDFVGLKVPVKITVDSETKEFEVEVGIPPTSALLLKELGKEKGSSDARKQKIGDLPLEKVINIAKMKMSKLLALSLKKATKCVLGTCLSAGITVNGEDPRVIQEKIDAGEFDELFKKIEEQ
ncbi:MAG: 50S ribosomal protein L11 [Candidatus Odinarchaeia archaeon]